MSGIKLSRLLKEDLMAALLLLSDYRMKKTKKSAPPKESEILVDMKTMRAFHAEMLSRFSATDAKIDAAVAQMNALFHKALLLLEEQNLRNKQAYDAAIVSYEAIQDLKSRIKPDCLEN